MENKINVWELLSKLDSRLDKKYIEDQISSWLISKQRLDMITAERYYKGEHDIYSRKRMVIDEKGNLTECENLINNPRCDNQYALAVDKKTNYLFSKAATVKSTNDNKPYNDLLNAFFSNTRRKQIKSMGKDSINKGITYAYAYINDAKELDIKEFDAEEVIPFWSDSKHLKLDFIVRYYCVYGYNNGSVEEIEKVEIYTKLGVFDFRRLNSRLVDENIKSYIMYYSEELNEEKGYNWDRLPIIPFKSNDKEIPLIKRVKNLQDGLNELMTDFDNVMQEDNRNTILILKNLDGTNLGEFRKNLNAYGAVKVSDDGGVDTLTMEVNASNYEAICKLLKTAIVENARSIDSKDSRLNGAANQMNIQSVYSEIDLDANDMENEYQASIEEMLWFVNKWAAMTGNGNFEKETATIVFNRDMLINESETIANCKNSVGIVSNKTILSMHPWVKDVDLEEKLLEEENAEMAFEQPLPEEEAGAVDEE